MKEIAEQHIQALLADATTYEKGFRLLVETYQEPLYRHIRRIVIAHDDTDDVLQNTFIKVFKNLAGFEGKSKLFTWLYRIATNEALTFLENKKRRFAETLDNPDASYKANTLKSDVYFDAENIEMRLQKAIESLPEKQRVVFNLRYYDEMPYEQMSEVLDTSVGALKASYHHAAKKIEAFLVG